MRAIGEPDQIQRLADRLLRLSADYILEGGEERQVVERWQFVKKG